MASLRNARIDLSDAAEQWALYLWGKNLTDERYRTQVLTSSVGFGESWGEPATYGVGVSFAF